MYTCAHTHNVILRNYPINFDDVPINTIIPLQSNPSSFSFIMESDRVHSQQLVSTASSGGTTHVNAIPVQPLYTKAVTPVIPVITVAAISDPKPLTSMDINRPQPLQATISGTTVTSENINSLQLPRRGINKLITLVSKSVTSEESSLESEGMESGEITNSDSEEEDTKPKPTKKAKWDNSLTPATTPEKNKLQLLCSIPKEYMRTICTPVSTPQSLVSKMTTFCNGNYNKKGFDNTHLNYNRYRMHTNYR